MFEDNIIDAQIYNIFSFGELIEFFNSLTSNIYYIRHDLDVNIIDDSKPIRLKKGVIISIIRMNELDHIKILKINQHGSSKETYKSKSHIAANDNVVKFIHSNIGNSKLSRYNIKDCKNNLKKIKEIRNALAHNMRLTEDDMKIFIDLKEEFFNLFAY